MKPKQSQAEPKHYPSDLTRTQWKRLKRLQPKAKPSGRPRSVDIREVLNGIFYITRGGCAWRMMPKDLPPWSTCYDYFTSGATTAPGPGSTTPSGPKSATRT